MKEKLLAYIEKLLQTDLVKLSHIKSGAMCTEVKYKV